MVWIIIIMTWIIVGILSFIAGCVIDMRGEEYDKHYLDGNFNVFLLLMALGYISPIIVMMAFVCTKIDIKECITRFLYNISNIGMNNKE